MDTGHVSDELSHDQILSSDIDARYNHDAPRGRWRWCRMLLFLRLNSLVVVWHRFACGFWLHCCIIAWLSDSFVEILHHSKLYFSLRFVILCDFAKRRLSENQTFCSPESMEFHRGLVHDSSWICICSVRVRVRVRFRCVI